MRGGRTLRIAAALMLAALIAGAPTPASASGPALSGAGSTWSAIALAQWTADVARQGLSINYQSVGSSAGRQFFIENQVDFAASEIPFYPNELAQIRGEHKSFQYMPDVAGGTSLMYDLTDATGARVTNLQLSAATAGGIFTGAITDWNDPKIAADNGGRPLPDEPIIPVIRSDGSGTSAQFSLYLKTKEPQMWAAFASKNGIPNDATSYWPNFPGSVAQKGSDGVANFVANSTIGVGAIGYVEYGYATQRGFPVAMMRNASGAYTLPTSQNVATALTHATLNADLTQNLGGVYDAPESTAYPMSSYSYLITETNGFDPAKGAVLGQFIIYFACQGQQEAALLGYSPLPPNLVAADFQAVERIPGAPTPPQPPLTKENCNNPTMPSGPGGSKGGPSPTPTGGPSGGPTGGGPSPTTTGSGPSPTTTGAGTGPTPTSSGGGTGPGKGNGKGNGTGNGGAGSPTPGTTSGASVYGASPTPSPVHTLSASQQAVKLKAAAHTVATTTPGSQLPLVIAAVAILALFFGPLVWQRRRSGPRDTVGPPGGPAPPGG